MGTTPLPGPDDSGLERGAEVGPAEGARLVAEGAFLLDVRNPDEWVQARAPGAVLLPLHELPHRAGEVPADRPVVVVCHSGHRSGAAARMLVEAGWDAHNLRGGMVAWSNQGLPIVHGAEPAGTG